MCLVLSEIFPRLNVAKNCDHPSHLSDAKNGYLMLLLQPDLTEKWTIFLVKTTLFFKLQSLTRKWKFTVSGRCAGKLDSESESDNKTVRGINYTSWRINQTFWLWRRRRALLSNHSHKNIKVKGMCTAHVDTVKFSHIRHVILSTFCSSAMRITRC